MKPTLPSLIEFKPVDMSALDLWKATRLFRVVDGKWRHQLHFPEIDGPRWIATARYDKSKQRKWDAVRFWETKNRVDYEIPDELKAGEVFVEALDVGYHRRDRRSANFYRRYAHRYWWLVVERQPGLLRLLLLGKMPGNPQAILDVVLAKSPFADLKRKEELANRMHPVIDYLNHITPQERNYSLELLIGATTVGLERSREK